MDQALGFRLWALASGIHGRKFEADLRSLEPKAESPPHRQRSTASHQINFDHSSNTIFAHSRFVHHTAPNFAGSCAAATVHWYCGRRWEKIDKARRVWNSEVTINTRWAPSDCRQRPTSPLSPTVDRATIAHTEMRLASGSVSTYLRSEKRRVGEEGRCRWLAGH